MRNWLMTLVGIQLLAASAEGSILSVYLTETPTAVPSEYTVDIYATATGTTTTTPGPDGDGGISSMGFDVIANGGASPDHGTGSDANVVETSWDPVITANFTTTEAIYTPDGGGNDAIGAAFSDGSSFTNTTMGLGGYVHIGSQVWTLTNGTVPATLTLNIVGASSYDFGNADGDFQDVIDSVSGTGVVLPTTAVPEPGCLSLLGLGAISVVARCRRA